MTLPLAAADDPVLHARCLPVGTLPPAWIDDLARELRETAAALGGLGLAAPQVRMPVRMAVLRLGRGPEPWTPDDFQVALDPAFLSHGDEATVSYEGCLSLPGRQPIPVRRWWSVRVVLDGTSAATAYRWLLGRDARIFQHELDHLNGVLISDPERALSPEEVARYG